MGGSSSKETPESAAQSAQDLQQKAAQKGGQPLQLQPGQTFQLTPNRGCTDILFLLLWILFWIGMWIIAGFGISKGEPERLQYGYDFNGHVCGVGVMEKRPYVYYPFPYPDDLQSGSLQGADFTWAVCVKSCPDPNPNPVSVGLAVPNSCMQSFKVQTEVADQNSILKPLGKTVLCGGNTDGTTDMNQFAPPAFLQYKKYCLKHVPVCKCKTDQQKSACCLPDATTGAEGSQVGFDTDSPQTRPFSNVDITEKERVQFNIPIGHRYGFCYVPYPSYIPGGEDKQGSWTRCIPQINGVGVAANTTTSYAASLSQVEAAEGKPATTDAEKQQAMDASLKAVIDSMSGPGETAKALVEQVRKYKWVIAGCAGIALLVSILYTFVLKVAAFPLILTIMIAVWVLLAGATTMMGFKAGYIHPDQIPGAESVAASMPEGVTFGPAQTNQELVIAGCVFSGICLLAYTIIMCVMIPRLKLACTIINIASVCLASMPTTLLFPVVQFVFAAILFTYFVIVLWYLASAGTWDPDQHRYIWDYDLQRCMIVHFFGLLWGQAFILAIGNLAIAGAAAEWFLEDDKKALSAPAINSAKRTLRYHVGTAAFGSFIIAVVQMVRWVFRYYMYQIKKLDKDGTFKHVIALLTCIGECCLDCLERFLNFINKNAYIQTAIMGNSFCKSAADACLLLIRNCLRVGTLQVISTVFIFLGKYFIALVVAMISAVWMVSLDSNGDVAAGWANVSSAPVFPVFVVLIMAFNIACSFLDVWDMVIDTIFQCYCMDEEYGTGKSPGEMKACVAANPPSASDIKAMDAVTTGPPAAAGAS